MIVDGALQIQVIINGIEVPFTKYCTLLVNQNVNVALPSLRMNLLDPGNLYSGDLPINDGTKLTIIFGDSRTNPRQINSVVTGTPPRKPSSGASVPIYNIHALLDAIDYIRVNPQNGFSGTASQVMGNIAQQMNFTLNNNAQTNDNMMWLPGRRTWRGFANLLSNHGWVNDKSVLHMGVDIARNLHFHDINQLFTNSQIKMHFVYGTPPNNSQIPVKIIEEYRAENHSAVLNNTYGYGLRMPQIDVTTGKITQLANVKAMTINNLLDMNKIILNSIAGRGRIDLPRISTGNSHQNYILAQHQNLRLRSTYSQVAYVLVNTNTGLTLFDIVQLTVKHNNRVDDSITGIYCVTAISHAVKGSTYKEKLQLTSAGPQNNNQGLI